VVWSSPSAMIKVKGFFDFEVETTIHDTLKRMHVHGIKICLFLLGIILFSFVITRAFKKSLQSAIRGFAICMTGKTHKILFGKPEMVPTYSKSCLSTEGNRHTPCSESV